MTWTEFLLTYALIHDFAHEDLLRSRLRYEDTHFDYCMLLGHVGLHQENQKDPSLGFGILLSNTLLGNCEDQAIVFLGSLCPVV